MGSRSRLSSFSTRAMLDRKTVKWTHRPQWATLEYAHVLASSHVPSDGSQARLRSAAWSLLAGGTGLKRNKREPNPIWYLERLFRWFNLDHVSWGLTVAMCLGSIASVYGSSCLLSHTSACLRHTPNPELPRGIITKWLVRCTLEPVTQASRNTILRSGSPAAC
jgi:hypothetical protein